MGPIVAEAVLDLIQDMAHGLQSSRISPGGNVFVAKRDQCKKTEGRNKIPGSLQRSAEKDHPHRQFFAIFSKDRVEENRHRHQRSPHHDGKKCPPGKLGRIGGNEA